MTLLSTPAKRIGLLLCLCLAMIASLTLQPQHANAATAQPSTTTMATNMLKAMNSERHAHHLPALTMNSHLITSAHRHDLTMARANSMSHQLPGEAVFSSRITKAGYIWRAAGENIGWTSPQTMNGLYGLQRTMYNEKAPDNGHRLNILSKTFHQVGINIYLDPSTHKLWFTQDFGLAR
jgi:uncharacterized protein YkwD